MFLFTLILFTFSKNLDYNELESFNLELSNYLSRKTNEDDFEEAIDKFVIDESFDKYILLIDSVQQRKQSNLDKVAENNSDGKYFALYSQKKTLNLTYILPQSKCIKEIKLQIPQNLSQDNKCNWVNGLKSDIIILNRKYPFKGEWKADENNNECINTNSIIIFSKFQQLDSNQIICFGDLEIVD